MTQRKHPGANVLQAYLDPGSQVSSDISVFLFCKLCSGHYSFILMWALPTLWPWIGGSPKKNECWNKMKLKLMLGRQKLSL